MGTGKGSGGRKTILLLNSTPWHPSSMTRAKALHATLCPRLAPSSQRSPYPLEAPTAGNGQGAVDWVQALGRAAGGGDGGDGQPRQLDGALRGAVGAHLGAAARLLAAGYGDGGLQVGEGGLSQRAVVWEGYGRAVCGQQVRTVGSEGAGSDGEVTVRELRHVATAQVGAEARSTETMQRGRRCTHFIAGRSNTLTVFGPEEYLTASAALGALALDVGAVDGAAVH